MMTLDEMLDKLIGMHVIKTFLKKLELRILRHRTFLIEGRKKKQEKKAKILKDKDDVRRAQYERVIIKVICISLIYIYILASATSR